MGNGYSFRGIGEFKGAAREFIGVWHVVMFVRFGIGGGVMVGVEFDWVVYVRGEEWEVAGGALSEDRL